MVDYPNSIILEQCPRCGVTWIPEGSLVCAECEPALNVDLALYDLTRAIQTLALADRKLVKNKISLIKNISSELVKFIKSLK